MFGLFKKNPVAKLEKEYKRIMAEAVVVQRSGDLRKYAEMFTEAEKIMDEIERLTAEKKAS